MDDAGKKAYEEKLRKVQESKATITIKLDSYPKTQDSEDDTDDDEFSHMVSDPQCKLTDIIQRCKGSWRQQSSSSSASW